jgi:hypothetical protein
MILKLNFWSFFSLHITFYQRLDDRMQAKKAKNALERPISSRDSAVEWPTVCSTGGYRSLIPAAWLR